MRRTVQAEIHGADECRCSNPSREVELSSRPRGASAAVLRRERTLSHGHALLLQGAARGSVGQVPAITAHERAARHVSVAAFVPHLLGDAPTRKSPCDPPPECGKGAAYSSEFSFAVKLLTADEVEKKEQDRKKSEGTKETEKERKERERREEEKKRRRIDEGERKWGEEKRRRQEGGEEGDSPAEPPDSTDASKRNWEPENQGDMDSAVAAADEEALEYALRSVTEQTCPKECPSCAIAEVSLAQIFRVTYVCGHDKSGMAFVRSYCAVTLKCEEPARVQL